MNKRKIAIIVLFCIVSLCLWYILPKVFYAVWTMLVSFYVALNIVQGSALVVAIAALIVAWNNFRRGNTAIIKLVDVGHCGRHATGINKNQPFSEFDLKLKNLGIPLKNPSVALEGSTRGGWLNLPLHQYSADQKIANVGTMEKGMIARYGLRSHDMNQSDRPFIAELVDKTAENVCISVYSDGYLVKRFYVPSGGLMRWLKRKWNSFASNINNWFAYDFEKWGRPFCHHPTILPTFNDLFWHLECFENNIKDKP